MTEKEKKDFKALKDICVMVLKLENFAANKLYSVKLNDKVRKKINELRWLVSDEYEKRYYLKPKK